MESIETVPVHGGSVVLLDEDLNAVSLRMYNEGTTSEDYLVHVDEPLADTEGARSFYSRICELVEPAEQPWSTFSDAVAVAVADRRQRLRDRVFA